MPSLSFSHLKLCIQKMERALQMWSAEEPGTFLRELYLDSLIKQFELTTEVVAKLLQKVLEHYCVTRSALKEMTYKDILRKAGEVGLIQDVERWFHYRNSRNLTAHEYGIEQAENIAHEAKHLIEDAELLYSILEKKHGTASN